MLGAVYAFLSTCCLYIRFHVYAVNGAVMVGNLVVSKICALLQRVMRGLRSFAYRTTVKWFRFMGDINAVFGVDILFLEILYRQTICEGIY